jgi:hypothetical protein
MLLRLRRSTNFNQSRLSLFPLSLQPGCHRSGHDPSPGNISSHSRADTDHTAAGHSSKSDAGDSALASFYLSFSESRSKSWSQTQDSESYNSCSNRSSDDDDDDNQQDEEEEQDNDDNNNNLTAAQYHSKQSISTNDGGRIRRDTSLYFSSTTTSSSSSSSSKSTATSNSSNSSSKTNSVCHSSSRNDEGKESEQRAGLLFHTPRPLRPLSHSQSPSPSSSSSSTPSFPAKRQRALLSQEKLRCGREKLVSLSCRERRKRLTEIAAKKRKLVAYAEQLVEQYPECELLLYLQSPSGRSSVVCNGAAGYEFMTRKQSLEKQKRKKTESDRKQKWYLEQLQKRKEERQNK